MGTKVIELSDDEVLVFHDWLHRLNESGDATFEDQAEQRCLWDLEASLERLNDGVLSHSYTTLLSEARARLRDVRE